MGDREDAVRKRINMKREEAAKEAEKKVADEDREYKELVKAIKDDTSRIIRILQDADWSGAELWEFPGKRSWRRGGARAKEVFAVFTLATVDNPRSAIYKSIYNYLCLRSDNSLVIRTLKGKEGWIHYPLEQFFETLADFTQRLDTMRDYSEALQSFNLAD